MAEAARKIIIIGSGCAGLTAALYAARAGLPPLLIEGIAAGGPAGGQLVLTGEVENYPGFPKGILGPDLMQAMREQAARFGSEFFIGDVTRIDLGKRPFVIEGQGIDRFEFRAEALILATGARPRKLGLVGEREPPEGMWGRGVTACATCDGAFFKGEDVAVLGGGDTAMEEATYLSHLCRTVTVIHRREEFRASKILLARARRCANIAWQVPFTVEEILGDSEQLVRGVRLRQVQTGAAQELSCKALFLGIGHEPNSDLLKGQLALDPNDHVLVGHRAGQTAATATSVAGVFAAGDLADSVYRQAVTAAGTGCQAAIDAERFLRR